MKSPNEIAASAIKTGLLSECEYCTFLFFTGHGCDICNHVRRTLADGFPGSEHHFEEFMTGKKNAEDVLNEARIERAEVLTQLLRADHGVGVIPQAPEEIRNYQYEGKDFPMPDWFNKYLPDLSNWEKEDILYLFRHSVLGYCPTCNFVHFVGASCDICAGVDLALFTEDALEDMRAHRANILVNEGMGSSTYGDDIIVCQMMKGFRNAINLFGFDLLHIQKLNEWREGPNKAEGTCIDDIIPAILTDNPFERKKGSVSHAN